MHAICYIVLFIAYALGMTAYGWLFWSSVAGEPAGNAVLPTPSATAADGMTNTATPTSPR